MAKFPRFLTLPVAVVMLISACGGGATPGVPAASGSAAPPASTGTGASEPAGSVTAGGEITVTSLWGGAEQTNFQKVLDAFTEKVVPILQERGLFRTEYAGSTLRDHYGLPRPDSQFARADLPLAVGK